jgi:hypothetical protein
MCDHLVLWASTEDRPEASVYLRIIQQIPPWVARLMQVVPTRRKGDKLAKYRAFAISTNGFGPALVESHTTNG